YSLWEVIINGDSPKPLGVLEGSTAPAVVLTSKKKLARRNKLKAHGTLLMSLPDKHQLKFNSHKDAKTLMEAIEKRFRGNTKTKKRNKTNLEEHSLDDLFNSLRIYEAEVKRSSSPSNPTQNIAFVSSSNTDSTTDSVSVATSVSVVCAQLPVSSHPNIDSLSNVVIFSFFASQSTSPQLDNEDLKHIDVDDLEEIDLRWQMAMLTMRARQFLQKTRRNLGDNRVTTMGFDMSKVKCYNCHRMGHFFRECSYQAEEELANFALMALHHEDLLIISQSNNKHNFGYLPLEDVSANLSLNCPSDKVQPSGGYNVVPLPIKGNFMSPKPDLVFNTAPIAVETAHSAFNVQLSLAKPAQAMSHITKSIAPIIEDWVSDSEDEFEPNDPQSAPSFDQLSEQVNLSRHSAQPLEAPILAHTPKPTRLKTNGSRKRKNKKTCFVCKGVDHLIKDCTFHFKPKTHPTPRNYVHRGYDKQYASSIKQYPKKHRVPAAVFTKSKPVSVTAARPVSVVVPKIMEVKPRHARSLHTKTNSIIRRHQTPSKFSKTSNSSAKVTDAHAKVVSVVKGKKGKWVWRLKHHILDHDFGASKLQEQLNHKDSPGRSKSVMAWIPKESNHPIFMQDSLLPIPFWAEAVNTACYVQNRVLVTKPQNKTPYELLHGRSPSIGFMRPFGCLVTILNTFDSLGKFEGKVDEGFLVGYSVNSKAFRVFNSQTRIVQETLHNKEGDTTFDGTEHDFEDFSEDSSNDVSAASLIVPAAGQNCSNSTNLISAARPLNSNSSSTHGNSSLRDASQSPDVLEMENIVYYDNENVGAEADFNNLESSITVSPIPTTRIYNAHPIS
nr:retrovirus-related Pol polyprotein from transposon TNT 1-94 [Tanacetum cinerariifolium]